VLWEEERHFWAFEATATFFGTLSGAALLVRQRQLDHRMYVKLQRQLASGV